MRVGLDLSCLIPLPTTGVGYATANLFRALMDRRPDWDFRVFAASAQPASDILNEFRTRASRFRVLQCPTRLHVALWTSREWPPIEWATGPIDLAHGGFHLLPATRKAKRLVTVHDLTGLLHPDTHTDASNGLHRRLLEHAARRADRVIAVSQSTKRDLVERLAVPEERVDVVSNGVFLEEFAGPVDPEALQELKDHLGITGEYFIHLGTIEPRKNVPRVLRAYARLRDRRRDVPQLVLAGKVGWKSEDMPALVRELRLEKDVVITGYLDRLDAVPLLQGAFACVYPSLYEGFGLPVLEAMAAGVPVLTSNVSSLPEVIGDTGLTVDPESEDEIEAALEALLDDPGSARLRAGAARLRAAQFTWANSAGTLAGIYEELAP